MNKENLIIKAIKKFINEVCLSGICGAQPSSAHHFYHIEEMKESNEYQSSCRIIVLDLNFHHALSLTYYRMVLYSVENSKSSISSAIYQGH